MSPQHTKSPAAAPRTVTLALAAAVVVATVLALVPSPVFLRSLAVFPLLVLIAGHSAAALVFGRGAAPGSTGSTVDDGVTGPDPVLRTVLPVLAGLLGLLAVVLLLAVLGIPVATPGIALGTGVLALVLLVLARWKTLRPGDTESSVRRSPTELVRRLAGPAVAVVVLAAAVAGAAALRPTTVERYTQLALDASGAATSEPLPAQAGTPVTLPWILRGYGTALPATPPAVGVTVGGKPAAGVRADSGPVGGGDAPGVTSGQRGSVAFTAPAAAGLYEVRVQVGSDASSTLVLQLEVAP
jgi:hypothetical protein